MKLDLEHGAFLELFEPWLAQDLAGALRDTLVEELRWEQRTIQLFGRSVLQPRLVAWCGAQPYRYSGQTLEPRSWTPAAERTLRLVERTTRLEFNHLLANLYRDGEDSMGLHADNEPELGDEPQVASVSFGATRRFRLKPRKRGESLTLDLPHNSLLAMRGSIQRHYVHGVAKQPSVRAPRLNLTFRRIVGE